MATNVSFSFLSMIIFRVMIRIGKMRGQ